MSVRQRRLRVAVLQGGRSGEHEVSLQSARAVMAALDRKQYRVIPVTITRAGAWISAGRPLVLPPQPQARPAFDVVFPLLHGTFGEDGTIQGLLELAGLPYVGAGVLGAAVGMDKDAMKRLFAQAELPIVDHVTVRREDWLRQPAAIARTLRRRLRFPMFVKPANLGSSVGISKVHATAELQPALKLAADYDRKILVEQGVDARELECSVLGNANPEASLPGEVIPAREFYDYAAKYEDAGSRTLVPAPISDALARRVRRLALRAFAAVDCEGLARVDFFLERGSGRLYVNEINTMPGFTAISMYPKLWQASGLPLPRLLDRLIGLALERAREMQRRRFEK